MGARRIWLRFFKRSNRAPRATVDPSKPGLLRAESSFPAEFATQHSRLFAVAQRVRRAPPKQARNSFAPHSVLREFHKSAKGAARTAKQARNCFAPHSVLREFLKSAKGAARTAKQARNCFAPRSVLREFLKSAKGAARTTKRARNCFAPHSVLREFLKSAKGAARTTKRVQELLRAALRFARVP